MPYRVVGHHGGGTRAGKLLTSGQRIVKLGKMIEEWRPDVAVSFSSVEAARVAFGLGIPHVVANDSPHSWMVARLTVPLAAYVCTPWIIKKGIWEHFGVARGRVIPYRALDPAAWLKGHHPDKNVLLDLGLDPERPIVVLRTEEAFASYLMGRSSDSRPVVGPVIEQLLKLDSTLQTVVSTRYGQQAPVLRGRFGRRVLVLEQTIDAASLLSETDVFIGSGGTMTMEAALLGVSAVSCFPGPKPLYISYLESKHLVRTMKSPAAIARETIKILRDDRRQQSQRERGRRLLSWMEDPTAKIDETIKRARGKWLVD